MPTFTYTGTNEDGAPVEETIEADDRFAVYDQARLAGHLVTAVRPAGGGLARLRAFNMSRVNAFLSRVKEDEVVMLSRNLAAMLHAGLSISRALSVAERQTKNPALKGILRNVGEEVERGQQLHAALAKHPKAFSRLYIAMVRAGEESGKLVGSLTTIAVQLERASNLKKKIRGAMIYPAIVVVAMSIIGALMMIYVVPTLTATFRELNVDLPLTTRLIIGISDFLSQHTLLAAGLVLATGGALIGLYRTGPGRRSAEWLFLHLPVIGTLVKETNAARTARTLSSLLQAGVDVVSAIGITKDVVQNTYYKDVLAAAAGHVEKGKQLSEDLAAHTELYPVLVGEMVAVGEETGQIAEMLEEIAVFYESEVERKTKDLSTIIEPILMLVIGAAVGIFALAMISPIYSISDSIN